LQLNDIKDRAGQIDTCKCIEKVLRKCELGNRRQITGRSFGSLLGMGNNYNYCTIQNRERNRPPKKKHRKQEAYRQVDEKRGVSENEKWQSQEFLENRHIFRRM
jgi:hypothetical protein